MRRVQRGTTFAQEVDSRVLIANAQHAAVAIEHGCEWISFIAPREVPRSPLAASARLSVVRLSRYATRGPDATTGPLRRR